MGWDGFLKIGGLAGWASFFWLVTKDLIRVVLKPRLVISSLEREKDIRTWNAVGPDAEFGWPRRGASLLIRNKKKKTAIRCVAKLRIISSPKNVNILEREFNLHWADVPYSLRTSGAEPIDIGMEGRRLDVVFTHAKQEPEKIPGCWVATPLALSLPTQNQFYLPPGDYQVELSIECENGRGQRKRYLIRSPEKWDMLSMEEISD